MLINPQEKDSITKCLTLLTSRNKKQVEKAENRLKEYFKKLGFSEDILRERRQKIEKFGKDFLDKSTDEIISSLNVSKVPIFIDDNNYETCLRQANYDLRLGESVYVTTEKVPKKLIQMGADDSIAIEPGEFGLLMTHEYIYVPKDLMGFISVRLTYKQKGLVNISGFHVDPGFYGRLMFAVYNAGPNDVVLRYKEPIFMIMFNELTSSVPKVIKSNWHGMKDIPIEAISGLRGASVSVRNLDERIKKLETIFPVLITILIGLIGIVLTWVLTKGWP